jgi:hypothetical protein
VASGLTAGNHRLPNRIRASRLELFLDGSKGNYGGVILILAKRGSFRLEHTNHRERRGFARESIRQPDRPSEEFFGNGMPQNDDSFRAANIRSGEERPVYSRPVANFWKLFVCANQLDVPVLIPEYQLCARSHRG